MKTPNLTATLSTAIFLCLASTAIADTTPSAASMPSAVGAKKATDPRLADQTVVCKREDTTGSRLGAKTICHTRAEWAAMSADARQSVDRIQNTPQTH